jgi:hypothetical protein
VCAPRCREKLQMGVWLERAECDQKSPKPGEGVRERLLTAVVEERTKRRACLWWCCCKGSG